MKKVLPETIFFLFLYCVSLVTVTGDECVCDEKILHLPDQMMMMMKMKKKVIEAYSLDFQL